MSAIEDNLLCVVRCYVLRNHRRRVWQEVQILPEYRCHLLRPREFWGASATVDSDVTISSITVDGVLRAAESRDCRIDGGDTHLFEYQLTNFRDFKSLPIEVIELLQQIDALFGDSPPAVMDATTESVIAEECEQLMSLIRKSPNDIAVRLRFANNRLRAGSLLGLLIQTDYALQHSSHLHSLESPLQTCRDAILDIDSGCRGEWLVHANLGTPVIRLGMVHAMSISTDQFDQFVEHAGMVFRTNPALVELRIRNNALSDSVSGAIDITRLLEVPESNQLTSLALHGCGVGTTGFQALIASKSMSSLEELQIYHDPIGDDGIIALAHSPSLGQLRRLTLFANELSHSGLDSIASSSTFSRLHELYIGDNAFGDRGATVIASTLFANLRSLVLAYNDIGPAGGEEICHSSSLDSLELLCLLRQSLTGPDKTTLRNRFGCRIILD